MTWTGRNSIFQGTNVMVPQPGIILQNDYNVTIMQGKILSPKFN